MSPSPHASNEPSHSAIKLEMIEGDIALVTFDQPNSRANTLNQPALGAPEEQPAESQAPRALPGGSGQR